MIKTDKKYIIGSDEVGTGAYSGPIVVAAIKAEKNWRIDGLNDSKQLTDLERRQINEKLLALVGKDIQVSLAQRTNEDIDNRKLGVCIKECYAEVADNLYGRDCLIIIDGNLNYDKVLGGKEYKTLIKADTIVPHVMAASIMAKVYRDSLMIELSKEFVEYNWHSNVGYGTSAHIAAIKKFGYTKYHRKSYKIKGLND